MCGQGKISLFYKFRQQFITHVSKVVWKLCGELARGRTRDRARSTQPLQTTTETRVIWRPQKIWEFGPLLSLSHSPKQSVLLSAFEPTPLPLNADVICERPLKVRSLLCEMVSNDKCTSLSTAQIRRVALFRESHLSHHHITLQMGFGSHGRLSRKPSLHSLSFRVPCWKHLA